MVRRQQQQKEQQHEASHSIVDIQEGIARVPSPEEAAIDAPGQPRHRQQAEHDPVLGSMMLAAAVLVLVPAPLESTAGLKEVHQVQRWPSKESEGPGGLAPRNQSHWTSESGSSHGQVEAS